MTDRKRLGQVLAITGAVFAVFGLYLLREAKPSTAADGRLARLLLDFFDPMTAALVATYSVMTFGVLVGTLGVYVLLSAKS
jgi:hypothetical protein